MAGFPSDVERCACLLGLIGSGHAGRLMLSTDYIAHWLGKPDICATVGEPPALPHWHPSHLFEGIVPALRRAGVTQNQLDTILVANPRRLFGGPSG